MELPVLPAIKIPVGLVFTFKQVGKAFYYNNFKYDTC